MSEQQKKRQIDVITEAALALDQQHFAEWWALLTPGEKAVAEATWRRAYFVAFVAGAGSELLKGAKKEGRS